MKRLPALSAAALSFCLLVGLNSCVKPADSSWQAERENILRSINEAYSQQEKTRKKIEEQEKRILEMENTIKTQAAQIDAFKNGRPNSRVTKRVPSTKTSSLAKKIDRIEASIQDSVNTIPGNQQSASEVEKNTYTSAYLAFKSNRYDEATSIFEGLLKSYPNGEYTDQTLYWLGESYLAQKKSSRAITTLSRLIKSFPESAKYASALLKLGVAYETVDQITNAKNIYKRLLKEHPDSDAAEIARQKLNQLRKTRTK